MKKSVGPLACQQIVHLNKYLDLLQNKTLKLEDVDWSELDYVGPGFRWSGYAGYQLLFLHQDGLYRIELESINGDEGKLSEINDKNFAKLDYLLMHELNL